jgi:diaminohydroxyphosphoribosylaminopyrimidine deaminase/5-amino-6-(5-phosphoribosylamino)uracil reductase
MPFSPLDLSQMQQALLQAEQAIGLSEPNPRVGCVLGHEDGRVLGMGFTQQAGGPHAEVMALRAAAALGHDVRGCTAWVTLEPCAHHGRTPPCCDALVNAGVRRVVVALQDPFPQVAGAGLARLRAAGVEVLLAGPSTEEAALANAALELNIGFFSRFQRGRPWVRLKAATSMDGKTALPDGQSQWITGEAARQDGHAWRRRAGAILTGLGTALHDDPRLDVRGVPTTVQPRRLLLDTHYRLPPTAKLLAPPGVLQVFGGPGSPENAQRQAALQAAGAQLCELPLVKGRPDLHALMQRLAQDGVNELHVEAGAVLNGALLSAGLVDECLVYVAPLWLGEGLPIAALGRLPRLADATRWQWLDTALVGGDLRIRARLAGPRNVSTPFTDAPSREWGGQR